MKHVRIFAAVNVSVPSVRKLAELQRKLRSRQPEPLKIKWVPPPNLHLTLKFYGNLSPEQVEAVADAAVAAARETAPFDVALKGLGAFPSAERPRVLWARLVEGSDHLAALHERLETTSSELGFARDERPFHGHLTLGRVRRGFEGVATWLEEHADADCLRSTVDEIVIYESRLHRTGAEYVSHYRIELDGK